MEATVDETCTISCLKKQTCAIFSIPQKLRKIPVYVDALIYASVYTVKEILCLKEALNIS